MPSRKHPEWQSWEIEVLREFYPLGGLAAVQDKLADRPWRAIYVKAHKLGIKNEMPSASGRRCALAGAKLDRALILREDQGFSFARIGAELGFCEASVANAVIMAQCVRHGYTPAERQANGRLTEASIERLRWMLRKGLKAVEIQLRLGVSAATVSEQRRRYGRELKERGKAPLPPPGGGEAYSGVKVPAAKRKAAEQLFLEGYGTLKVHQRTGVSKTVCTRIRNRLIERLRRKGETLPGCDFDGVRRVQKESSRHVPPELVDALKDQLRAGIPVARAARLIGIGSCRAYRIRNQMMAEGWSPPQTQWRTSEQLNHAKAVRPIPGGVKGLYRYRELLQAMSPQEARALLEDEQAELKRAAEVAAAAAREAARPKSFEEKLAAVSRGELGVVAKLHLPSKVIDRTLGGVATGSFP